MREHAGAIAVPHDQHVRGRRSPGKVHDVGHLPGFLEAPDDPHGLCRNGFLRLVRGRADVVCAVDAWQPDEIIVKLADSGSGLVGVDVEAHAELLLAHRCRERRVVHDLTTRGVDENRSGLQSGEQRGVHHSFRVGRQRDVHAEHVRAGRDICRRGREVDPNRPQCGLDAHLPRFELVHRPVLAVEPAAPHDDVHAETRGAANRLLADTAHPEQAERPPIQPLRVREFLLVPPARAQFGDVVGHTAIQREDQGKRKLRHGNGILAGAVRHVDAAGRSARDIDRVVAGAGPDDEREMPGVEHVGGDLRAAHHQDVRASRPHRFHQRAFLEIRLVQDFAAGFPQAVDAALLELVGNYDLHAITAFI